MQAFKPSNYTHPHLTPHPPTGSPYTFTLLSILVGDTYIFMVSTHIYPKHTPYTPNTPTPNLQQSYSSTILVSFLHFIFWINIPLRPDEVASVWMPAKACHDFIMILLCFSTTSFFFLTEVNDSEWGTLAHIGMALTILSMATVIFLHFRKSKLCRGHRFSNIVKIVLFISDVQNYITIKLCKTSGSVA